MKVVLTPIGSAGDVFPSVGLACRLRERGHDVVLITSSHFADLARRFDLPFVGLGDDQDFQRLIHDRNLWDPRRGFETVMRIVLGGLEPLYGAVLAAVEPGRTVVAAHPLDFASRLLQEERGLPVASVHLQPTFLRSAHQSPVMQGAFDLSPYPGWVKSLFWWAVDRLAVDPVLVPPLNRLRAAHGLAPIHRPLQKWIFSPDLVIGLFPRWFAPPQPDWPPQLRLTGFPLFDATEPVPPELDRFLAEGEPPVVVTLGTANAYAAEHLATGLAACQRLGRRGVLLSAVSEPPAPLPPGVRHVAFAPLSQVLPRCAAVVHHGGIGTTAAALSAGVPQVVVPLSHDQPDHAARVLRLGAGERLFPRQLTPTTLAAALDRLLHSEPVRARCAELAALTRADDGLDQACTHLESLLAQRAPQAARG